MTKKKRKPIHNSSYDWGGIMQYLSNNPNIISSISNHMSSLASALGDNNPTEYAAEKAIGLPSNFYDVGGVLGAVDTGLDIASEAIQTSKGIETRPYLEKVQNFGNQEVAASSNDELLNSWASRTRLNRVRKHDITGGSWAGDIIGGLGSNASAAGKGAIAGFQVGGPWGGAIGAIVGGVANGLGQIFGGINTNRKMKKLNKAIRLANSRQDRAYEDAATNLAKQQTANVMYNYAAFGGPLYGFMDGPSSYDIAKDNAFAKQLNAQMKGAEAFSSLPSEILADGGGIHIAPSKRGTFTAAATKHGKSVQEFASQVLANPDNYSSTMVKKANFARNAAKWHANGGLLSNNFTNGVTLVNEGGTHENNPHEGVMMGIAPDGKPNLVEEGEAIFNDYVFSNRLRVPKEVRNKYKLRGPKNMTFAEAFRKAQKESEERPNDPISQNGLDNIAMILARTQEAIRGSKNSRVHKAPYGGRISKKDRAHIDSMDEEVYEPEVDAAIEEFRKQNPSPKSTLSNLRYLEPLANATAVFSDLAGKTNNPYVYDFVPPFQSVGFTPISNYIPETHFDTRYAANQNAQQAAATRNAIMQSNSPSRNAALLASDFNAQIANGELLRQAALDEYNRMVEREKFNSSINQANSQLGLHAAMANQNARLRYGQSALEQAKMNVDETNMTMAAKAQNISNLAESVANIGREEDAKNWRDWYIMSQGRGMDLEGIKANITPSKQYQYAKSLGYTDEEIKAAGIRKAAYGGKLRKKKGLTY